LTLDLAKAVPELLTKLWDRSHLLWWALSIGSFLGFAVLAAIALTGSPAFVEVNKTASPWLLLASIIFATFAVVKHFEKRTIQTVKLFPDERQSFYHGPTKQIDGSTTTHIGIRFEVFNVSDKSIWLPDVTLIRPRSHAPVRVKHVSLKDQSSDYYGPYELPPGAKTRGSVDLMIQEDLTEQIARTGVVVSINDQFGHGHKIKLPKIKESQGA
jgi:hypothetical protein